MNEAMPTGGWLDRQAAREASKDRMSASERGGQVIGAIISILIALYFLDLYTSNSGFFTSAFSSADAVLFFGIAFLGIIPGLAKAVAGRKNVIRPLEIIMSIVILLAAVWFLLTFPFDFSHLADALPSSLQFLLSWITDGIAKVVLVIAILATLFFIPYNTVLYLAVRSKLHK